MPTLSVEAAIMVCVNIHSIMLCFVYVDKNVSRICRGPGIEGLLSEISFRLSRDASGSDVVPAERP